MRLYASLRSAIAIAIGASVAVTVSACATGAGGSAPAGSEQIAESARSLGIAPELVYTTDVDGYELAAQSVNPSGAAGLSATWFNEATGGMLTIRTELGEITAETCTATPLDGTYDAAVTCEEGEDGLWHRSAGDAHEYVVARDAVLIRVSGQGAPAEDLRTAAQAVHVPSAAELELLFSDVPELPSGPPVERGDIPDNGDGAPVDPSAPGG
ncbi:hypothetical protein ACI3KS_16245 [Microbacterium sp. ZW T5_45]|uniref:hypothetical protein n=1 Tax=Microbacterium sp. ZW T5_45 TaxID=3378080 RepID=UPI00385559DF